MPLLVCPNCNVGMTNVQRSGVEIDICPQCRGVWLDRGELEKLLQPLRDGQEMPSESSFLPSGFAAGNAASVWGGQSSSHQSPGYYGHSQVHGDHHEVHGYEKSHPHDGHNGHQQKGGIRSILDIFG